MKKIIILTTIIFVSKICLSQGYFEKKINRLSSTEYGIMCMESISKEKGNERLKLKTLIIPKYSEYSIFNKITKKSDFSGNSKDNKSIAYNDLIKNAVKESNFPIPVNIDSYSKDNINSDKLFLAFSRKNNNVNANIFEIDAISNKEILLHSFMIGHLNIGNKSDMIAFFNLLNESLFNPDTSVYNAISPMISATAEELKYIKGENTKLNKKDDKDLSTTIEKMNETNSYDKQESFHRYNKSKFDSTLDIISNLILAIPKHEKNKLNIEWKFSNYEFIDFQYLNDTSGKFYKLESINTKKVSVLKVINVKSNKSIIELAHYKKLNSYKSKLDFFKNYLETQNQLYSLDNTQRFFLDSTEIDSFPNLYKQELSFIPIKNIMNENINSIKEQKKMKAKLLENNIIINNDTSSQFRIYFKTHTKSASTHTGNPSTDWYGSQTEFGQINEFGHVQFNNNSINNTYSGSLIISQEILYTFLIYDKNNRLWYNVSGEPKIYDLALEEFINRYKLSTN